MIGLMLKVPNTAVESVEETRFMIGPMINSVNGTMMASVKAGTNINCRISGLVFLKNYATCVAAQPATIAVSLDWE